MEKVWKEQDLLSPVSRAVKGGLVLTQIDESFGGNVNKTVEVISTVLFWHYIIIPSRDSNLGPKAFSLLEFEIAP